MGGVFIFIHILWGLVIAAAITWFSYSDYKKKKRQHKQPVKSNADKKVETQIAIEKEKSKKGFADMPPFH